MNARLSRNKTRLLKPFLTLAYLFVSSGGKETLTVLLHPARALIRLKVDALFK